MMVPAPLRSVLGRREFTKSLGVADRREAERLAYPIIGRWLAEIEAAKTNMAMLSGGDFEPTSADLEELAVLIGFDVAGERAADLTKAKARLGREAYENLRAKLSEHHGARVRERHAGDLSYWTRTANRHLERRGWRLPVDHENYRSFIEALANAGIDALARAIASVDGNEQNFTPSPATAQLVEERINRARPGETIKELFDRYATQRLKEGTKRQDSIDTDRRVISEFNAFVGIDRSLPSITIADVREWRDVLASLPLGFRKRNEFKDLSLRDACALLKAYSGRTLQLVTVNKMLSALSAFLTWARREGYTESNVADGLFFAAPKRKKRRPPFNADQLNSILRSPLFSGSQGDGREHVAGEVLLRDWRYWIPLVALFTGARIGEIAQLRANDIRCQDGVWIAMICSDEEVGQVTKTDQSRPAVLHSLLIKMGFADFVTCARNEGRDRLFPELERNGRGHMAKPSRFWRDYLRRIGIKEGADGYGAHSFRHGLADQLRVAGYLDRDIEVALGHNQSTVTAGYGQLRQGTVQRLSEMIESARFEGIDFAHLIPA